VSERLGYHLYAATSTTSLKPAVNLWFELYRHCGSAGKDVERCRPIPRSGGVTELVATAIANVQARADVGASRARIVAVGDDPRPPAPAHHSGFVTGAIGKVRIGLVRHTAGEARRERS
jgi:hypothetical protein